MNKYILLLFGAYTLLSCSQKDKYQDAQTFGFADFDKEISIAGKTLEFNDLVMHPSAIQVYDSILITLETSGAKLCNIYNVHTKEKIGERLMRGQGPNEMLMPEFIENDGLSMQILDMATSVAYTYDVEDFIKNPNPEPISKVKLEESLNSGMQVLGNNMIGYPYFKERQLYVFNMDGKKVGEFAEFPSSSISYSDIEKTDAYYMGFITNGKDKTAICYYMTDLIEIYNSNGLLEKRMHGPERFFAYFNETSDGENLSSSPVKGRNRDAYFSPKHAGDHFLVLYNGGYIDEKDHSSYCTKMFSFSWDGTPGNIYVLNDPIFTFCVDKKRKKIYGISKTPDYHIVEYDWNKE